MDVEYEKLTGDPDMLERKGAEYQAIAKAIRDSVATLDDIVDQVNQKSLAMDATRSLAEDVADDIRKATDRYQATGKALSTYAVELRSAQDASETAAIAIVDIEADLVVWRGKVTRRQSSYDAAVSAGDADEISAARTLLRSAEDKVDELETALETRRREWEDARDAKVVAATTAADAIHAVVGGEKGNELNDGFWDHVGVIVEVLKVICDIAAILSVFLAWVPFLGQFLLVLAAIGAIIAIVDAAIKFANGEGSLGSLILAVVVGVISLFGGKLIGMAAQRIRFGMTQTMRGVSGSPLVNLSGRGAAYQNALNAFPKKVPQGFLGALKSPFVRSIDDLNHMGTFLKATGFKGKLGAAGSILKEVLKQSNPFNLKSLFKFDSDVADVFNLTSQYGDFFDAALHNKANLVVILEAGHTLYDLGRTGIGLTEAITGGDVLGGVSTTAPHLSGPVPRLVGGGAKLWKDLGGF